MVDRRHDDEKIEMLTTTNTHLSTGEPMYTAGTVEDVMALPGETVAFDEIYPEFVHASGRVTEPDFESAGDVDDFIAALPVKEMREVYRDVCLGGSEECVHNFLWMMRWLRTCMELSEIERPNIQSRLRYYRCLLGRQRVKLDEHIERHIAMKADSNVTDEALERHCKEGLNWQTRRKVMFRLAAAMDVVDILVDQLKNEPHWKKCECAKCAYYSSPQWLQDRPDDLAPKALKPKWIRTRR
ncbi:hypothetical protein PR003_g15444 [Phytophthora rubi]|uniref:Uncharacterized protein n=1 Tax=Phytophthora rubi TaxID=129364 RepID=A0A6A4EY97_9STRA|nr:hypothetical protein PR003_g15444 [Phytophthora rubi]